jgi:hypothetical protein
MMRWECLVMSAVVPAFGVTGDRAAPRAKETLSRGGGMAYPQTKTWFIIGGILAAVSGWLFSLSWGK